ncbi:hypothetical protein [Lutimonas sp.]|uniref:hypothetical protein n=1 Tax=Lutimonas sp. TaxID=1872403 RepID=UPI003D9BDAC3
MKTTIPLLVIVLLVCSCKNKETVKDQNKQSTEIPIKEFRDEMRSIKNQALRTSTGKNIQLIIREKTGGLNDFTVVSADFENMNDSLIIKDADPLQYANIVDLDHNGYDELYLITSSSGSGSYGSIFGFASNQDLSLTSIYIPEITENDVQLNGSFYGYMGHDSIYFENDQLFRKYPVYKEGDPNCCPSGGYKTHHYTLKAGEASWILAIEE